MRSQKQAFGLLLVTFFIWGSVYVGGKLISDGIPSPLLACLRCTLAMIPLSLMARNHRGVKIEPQDRKWFFLVGLLAHFFNMQMVQLGIALTGASTAALLNAMTPVAITLLAAVILKEKITPIKCLCLLLAIAGTVVITSDASMGLNAFGIAAVLAGIAAFAAASVLMRRLTAKYPPILVTAVTMAVSLIFHIPVGVYTALTRTVTVTPLTVGVLLYLGIVCAGVGQFTWTRCLSILPASTCSLFYPLQPVFSALLGSVLLHETFTPAFFAGLLLISLDIVLNTVEARRQTAANP